MTNKNTDTFGSLLLSKTFHIERLRLMGGNYGEVRRLRGVILEGEEIEGGHFGT